MANLDDLDDFFKKKDRKGKKQTGLLTNNEELLKQLMIVTSATSAFKENMDFDDDDDEESHRGMIDENLREPADDNRKIKAQPATRPTEPPVEALPSNQQDEWEDFEDARARYDQIRSKLNPNQTDDGQNDDGVEEERDEHLNHDEHNQLPKDRPAWKLTQVQPAATETPNVAPAPVEEVPVIKPASVYRPPQMRTAAGGVTIVSGVQQRPTKKEKPNLASTEDFPTLGKTGNKK